MNGEQWLAIALPVIALMGGIGGAIRWAGNRITKSMDDNGKRIDKNTDAMIDNTRSNTELKTEIKSIATFVQHATPPTGIQQGTKKRAQTKPQMAIVPAAAEPDDEES